MQDSVQNRFDKLEWMPDQTDPLFENERDEYIPPYGDITEFNTCRLIMDSVGVETLEEIGKNAVNLLETSVAIYEANGDYAFGMFSSGWCRIMDAASRKLCKTDDNRKALSCGKWLCHENCWNDSAKRAIETGKCTDIECVGGIHLYAEPIYAGQSVIGAINIGYGNPPESPAKLKALADAFDVDPEKLKEIGDRYKSRPRFIVDVAKKLLGSFARLIGEIVEKAEARRKQKEMYEREAYLNNVLKAIRDVNQLIVNEDDPSRLIQKACEELNATRGYFNAWIALLDKDGRNVTLTGSAGLNGGFKSMQKLLDQGCFPSCMHRTLETRGLVVVDDPATKCTDCPLANQYEGRSALTHRLENFGILSVSVPAHFAHDVEEQELFVEVANDLAFALSKIESEKEIQLQNYIIQTTPQPMSLVSSDYRYLVVNKAYSQFFGESPEAVNGRPLVDFIDSKVFEKEIKPNLDRCLKGESVQYETLVDFAAAGPRWMRMEYTPYRNRDNRIVGVVSHGLDITERRQAESALKKSEEKIRQVYEHMAIGVATVSLEFRIESANDAYCSMLGYSEIELIGKHLKDITHPEILEDNISKQAQLAEGEIDHFRMDKSFIHKSGRIVDGILDANLIRDADGKPSYFIGSVLDISDRKRAAKRLDSMERRNQALLDHSPVCHKIVDLDFNLQYMSANGFKMLKLEQNSQVYGNPYPFYFFPDSFKNEMTKNLMEVRDTGKTITMEAQTNDIQGNEVWLDSALIPVFDGDNIEYITVVSADVTRRKRDEKEKERLEGQLRQAQKMEAIGRLAGGVAHDFNNMLSVIIGHSEMAMEQLDPSQALYQSLEEIRNAGKRSANLTRQLLAFARRQTVAPKVLDLNETVNGMIRMLHRLIGEDIDLILKADEKTWRVKIDPSQVDQILANLCVNARDAIDGVGKIAIETGTAVFDEADCTGRPGFLPGEYVMLAVSDDGCGMSPEVLENIFDPFYSSKTVDKGTGLGLSTVYGVVKQNNGFINVYSEPEQGTTFRIYLPRHRTKRSQLPEKDAAQPSERGDETVLLVEDEPSILRMTAMMIEKLGYRVLKAGTPGEAIQIANEYDNTIHLLLTDVVMPEMNGRELAKNILSSHPNLKRLFMSGYTTNVIAHHGVLDEGVNFIQKPFSKHDLSVKLRQVLDDAKN